MNGISKAEKFPYPLYEEQRQDIKTLIEKKSNFVVEDLALRPHDDFDGYVGVFRSSLKPFLFAYTASKGFYYKQATDLDKANRMYEYLMEREQDLSRKRRQQESNMSLHVWAEKVSKAFGNGPRFIKAEGEGSRGGHIVGHTSKGKPIYAHSGEARKMFVSAIAGRLHNHSSVRDNDFEKFKRAASDELEGTWLDHVAEHLDNKLKTISTYKQAFKKAKEHRADYDRLDAKNVKKAFGSGPRFIKAEGSRGGKVVGHDKYGKAVYERIDRLPKVREETWDDGTHVVFRKSPFPYRQKPVVPSKHDDSATVVKIPLDKLNSSQKEVTESGIAKHMKASRAGSKGLPLVYAESDGRFTIGDGHHRLVADHLKGKKLTKARVVPYMEDPFVEKAEGEGSRGGHITGHDKHGKPVYENSKYVYHVTTASRLPSIANGGLQSGQKRHIGGTSYDAHSKGKVFMTCAEGTSYWHDKAKAHVEHNHDDWAEHVPVILRAARKSIKGLRTDKVGTSDARHEAHYVKGSVEPHHLEVWHGSKWAPVSEHESLDRKLGSDNDGYLHGSRESKLFPDDLKDQLGKSEVEKALPKKSKEPPVKQAPKQTNAGKKAAGAGGKTRYGYSAQGKEAGKPKPPGGKPAPTAAPGASGAAPEPPPKPTEADNPVTPQPEIPKFVDPSKLAGLLQTTGEVLKRVAKRFIDNASLGGKQGFIKFFQNKFKALLEKHDIQPEYLGMLFDSLTKPTSV